MRDGWGTYKYNDNIISLGMMAAYVRGEMPLLSVDIHSLYWMAAFKIQNLTSRGYK